MKILIEILDFDISLFWCPAHVEVDENEAVDQLAKLATEGNMLCIRNCKQTLANIQQIARKKFKIDKKKKPITRNNIQLTTLPYKIFDSLKKLEQAESSIIYQLQSGHSPLNNYLHKIKKIDSPNCSECKTVEDVQHYLVNCS
jgi:hypothetical protein